MELTEKLYWTKVLLGLAMAIIFSIVSTFLLSGLTTFILGITVYLILSDFLGRRFGLEQSAALKIGVGAYFFTWLTTWIIIHTILNTPS